MAASSSLQKTRPQSVADPDKEAWETMVAKQRAINEKREQSYWDTRPGLGESMLPVWGSAREAIADYREGDYWGAAGNAALAALDLTGEGYVGKALIKGGVKSAGSHTWNATRKWMGKRGDLEKFQHGHHWAIPQRAPVPDVIKNQPWNIKAMPSPETHGRLHGRYAGKPQFGVVERFIEGTPAWFKVQTGLSVGEGSNHLLQGIDNERTQRERR